NTCPLLHSAAGGLLQKEMSILIAPKRTIFAVKCLTEFAGFSAYRCREPAVCAHGDHLIVDMFLGGDQKYHSWGSSKAIGVSELRIGGFECTHRSGGYV